MSIGCGQFTDEQWSDFLFTRQREPKIQAHLATCRACRLEADGLRSTARHLSALPGSQPAVRAAFVESVLAEVSAVAGGAAATQTGQRSGKGTQAPAPSSLWGGGRRWRLSHSVLSAGAAACLMLVIAVGTGVIPWQPGSRSATPLQPHSISASVLPATDDPPVRVTTHGVTQGAVPAGMFDWLRTQAEPMRHTPGLTILVEEDRT